METIKGLKRSDYCGTLTLKDEGREVTLFGWAQRQRDLGNLIFIDLRDKTGIVQISFNDKTDRAIFEKAQSVRSEYVLALKAKILIFRQAKLKLKLRNCVLFQRRRLRRLKLQRQMK